LMNDYLTVVHKTKRNETKMKMPTGPGDRDLVGPALALLDHCEHYCTVDTTDHPHSHCRTVELYDDTDTVATNTVCHCHCRHE
jgi:hypothetical protein